MVRYEKRKLFGGSTIITLWLFNYPIWSRLKSESVGWFRLFGFGLNWVHNSIEPLFSERIGKRKKIRIGNYRFGILK